jgi:metal-responsive CopG/Arc/MetJ family transcriptional regulator
MATMNISITDNQAKAIDRFTKKYDFENRSEFFRTFIRYLIINPSIIEKSVEYPFAEPFTRSRSKMYKKIADTGKYSKEFLTDLKAGLKDSKVFFNQK